MSWVGSRELTQKELEDIEQESRDKEAFAIALIHWPANPLAAAFSVYPKNPHKAQWVAQFWPNDPYVQAHRSRLLTDISQLLPSKAELAVVATKIAHSEFSSDEAKIKALRFISDLCGWTGSAVHTAVITNNAVSSANRVMEVPVYQNMDQWEARAIKQQEDLTTTYKSVEEK